nr:hypothetical protein [Virgibacillus indicus]
MNLYMFLRKEWCFLAKEKNPTFILELKLSTELWQTHILNTRFEIARKLYNTTLSYALKQLQRMKESKQYRQNIHEYRKYKSLLMKARTKKEEQLYKKELTVRKQTLNTLRKSHQLTKFSLHGVIAKHQRNYNTHIDSHTGQKIADAVCKSMEEALFKGNKAHFKKYGTLTSVEGKTNASGIRFKKEANTLYWLGLKLPVIIRENDLFSQECIANHRIKYCRIVKKVIRGKDVFYIQLVMAGIPPAKRINTTGEFRHKITPSGRVGIDIGTSTVAVSSKTEVFLQPLAPKIPQFDQEKRRLLRKLDRSKRSMNPYNFNEDGTIKPGVKLVWKRSKNYIKTLYQLKELYRKRSVYVKEQHSKIANHILRCGDEVYVEKMSFKGLAKRSKMTKHNKKGKLQSKKRFGTSIGSYAPALLISIINQKLGYSNKEIYKINTYTFKASQYNHITDTYQKKKLSMRWTAIAHHRIQRDLYSAFLIMNSNLDLKKTNRGLCKRTFDGFIKLHNKYIDGLKQQTEAFPSSMGIKKAN